MAVSNKIFIPTFISSINYEPVRTLPHIYFYNGLKDCETYFIQHYPSGSDSSVSIDSQSAFPYYDYYDGVIPNGDSNSLLFFNELPAYGDTPSGSLYTEYWDTYVSLLYNPRTRLFKASAIIPLADYFEMELNDIVQWRGNYYHLRAINDYNLKDGTCQIELLGPIIRDAVDRGPAPVPPGPPETCAFTFSSSLEDSNVDTLFVLDIVNNTNFDIFTASWGYDSTPGIGYSYDTVAIKTGLGSTNHRIISEYQLSGSWLNNSFALNTTESATVYPFTQPFPPSGPPYYNISASLYQNYETEIVARSLITQSNVNYSNLFLNCNTLELPFGNALLPKDQIDILRWEVQLFPTGS